MADSLFAEVARRWPVATYASRARIGLAQTALTAGDTAAATEWYRAEMEGRAEQAKAAQHFLADLAAASGDTAAARALWMDLAQSDSVGYYGTIAFAALPTVRPSFAPPPPRHGGAPPAAPSGVPG